jgi:hypothetical protein
VQLFQNTMSQKPLESAMEKEIKALRIVSEELYAQARPSSSLALRRGLAARQSELVDACGCAERAAAGRLTCGAVER